MTRSKWILVAAFAVALGARLYVALSSTYIWDEEREWIPLAQSISFEPGAVNLPLRALSHPILSAYIIKLGTLIAGENALGFRLMTLLAGVATILVVARIAYEWRGPETAFWAAALMAFNEYHIGISAVAIDKGFQLFFAALAVGAFVSFLLRENPRSLYAAGLFAGLSFFCKETSVLLLPAFLAGLVASPQHRAWLRRREPYLAALVFTLVVLPDVFINLRLTEQLDASYFDHAERIGGIGFSRQYLLFFGRDAVAWVYDALGWQLFDIAEEYPSMNFVLGLTLLGGAAWTVVHLVRNRSAREDGTTVFLALLFWIVLGFFMLIEPGQAEGLTMHIWFWVDLTLIPGALMAGALLASLSGAWRVPGRVLVGTALLRAVVVAGLTSVGLPRGPDVAFHPENFWPRDGRMVNVEASFNYCMICEPASSVALADIQLRAPDGTISPALGTDDVILNGPGVEHTRMVLRAREFDPAPGVDEQADLPMWYAVSYELTNSNGEQTLVEARVAFHLRPVPPAVKPAFWAVR